MILFKPMIKELIKLAYTLYYRYVYIVSVAYE